MELITKVEYIMTQLTRDNTELDIQNIKDYNIIVNIKETKWSLSLQNRKRAALKTHIKETALKDV